jgi:hypothetical protein
MRSHLIPAVIFLATLNQAALALEDTERTAIRDIIANQWDAFKSDDAERAFSYASPAIRQIFGDANTFMAMVRSAYSPVYHPHDPQFGPVTESVASPTQSVTVLDEDGNVWTALYSMEKQADGSWRISGCRLIRSPSA